MAAGRESYYSRFAVVRDTGNEIVFDIKSPFYIVFIIRTRDTAYPEESF